MSSGDSCRLTQLCRLVRAFTGQLRDSQRSNVKPQAGCELTALMYIFWSESSLDTQVHGGLFTWHHLNVFNCCFLGKVEKAMGTKLIARHYGVRKHIKLMDLMVGLSKLWKQCGFHFFRNFSSNLTESCKEWIKYQQIQRKSICAYMILVKDPDQTVNLISSLIWVHHVAL